MSINYFHKAPKEWIRERDNRNPFLLMFILLLPFIIAIILEKVVYKGGFFDISGNPHWPSYIVCLIAPACTIIWFYLFKTNDIAVVFHRIYDDIDPTKVKAITAGRSYLWWNRERESAAT